MKPIPLLLFVFFAVPSYAQVDPIDKNGVAIGGYDVVAYHVLQKSVKGNESLSTHYGGGLYYFSSSENRELFMADPQKYLPQFEGYCALAISYGKKISIDPETFKLKDEKLYLFFHGKTSTGKVNSIETWNKNEARLLQKANANWPDVKKKKYKPEDTL